MAWDWQSFCQLEPMHCKCSANPILTPGLVLVPRLKGQMVLGNGLKLALDWLGMALDLLGLAQIGQLTNFPFVKN